VVNGNELLRKLNWLGHARGVQVPIDEERGKGSLPPFTSESASPLSKTDERR